MSHSLCCINHSLLKFCMTDHLALRRSLAAHGPVEVAVVAGQHGRIEGDALPNSTCRAAFAELAVELGLREVES